MVNRRDVLRSGASAVGVGLASAAGAVAQAEPGGTASAHHKRGWEILRTGTLMNLDRAYQVMAEENLDGLVMAHPTNVYHLTGYWDHVSIRYDAPASLVLLSRDERQAPGLVMSQFLYYYSFADNRLPAPLQTYLYTGWDDQVAADREDAARFVQEPNARPPFVFANKGDAPQRPIELHRLDMLNSVLKRNPLTASAEWALIKAARAMGLDRGRIGYDLPVVAGMYDTAGLQAETTYAERAIRKIRMIKSQREIDMMRLAAQANADAALAAVKTVRAGATHSELRATFFAESAKRGNSGLFMQIDTVMAETTDDRLVDGTAFAIDCVSLGFRYFGDYGRTIFVGEPSRSMKRVTDAISFAWDEVRAKLKPGLRYSEITEHGRAVLKKAGYDYDVAFTPHSVGLAHTDEPGRGRSNDFWVKDDIVLQENMILSVDLPIRQSGIGGSAHLEDLTLITKDGGIQINDIGDRVVMI